MGIKKHIAWSLVLGSFAALTACGGGGGGGGTATEPSPMTVASNVSVVSPTLTNSVAAQVKSLRMGVFKVTAADLPAASDYNKDKINVYVQERSAEQFNNINEILCMVGQTKYDAMLNKGDYIALVDQNLCKTSGSDASNAGQQSQNQSSGADMPNYMKFVVNSSRTDNSSPEIVKAWVHQPQSNNDKAGMIYANISITESTSDTNPYGVFTMNFAGYPVAPDGTVGTTVNMKGILQAVHADPNDPTSKVLLQFAGNDSHNDGYCGDMSFDQKVTLDRSSDGSTGAGKAYANQTTTLSPAPQGCVNQTNLGIAYNTTDFFRSDLTNNTSVCLNRANIDESAWSYGLYDANGARVQRNSGFPIQYTPAGGTSTYNGWIGYWGLWIDNSVTIPNGATVNKVDYNGGSSTSTPYTVFEAGGKLKKHTRQMMTLNDIKGIPLSYFEQPVSGGTGTNYQVVWDSTALKFNKVAQMPQNCNGNCTWATLTAPYQTIDVTHLPWSNLNFWSDSLSGQVQVPLGTANNPCSYVTSTTGPGYTTCPAPDNTTPVVFYAENLVYPGDTVPATLACFDSCPTATSVAGINIDANGNFVVYNTWDPQTGQSQAHNYTFDSGLMTLMDGSYSAITTTTTQQNQWGFMTGALFDPTTQNMNLLACPWNTNQTCGWQAWSVLPEFYTWETGPNNWNQFVALEDPSTGAILKFDPPLMVQYQNAAGAKFMLQYAGFGQLNGIPGKCVDMDTGAEADCSQSNGSNSIRWVPAFTIPPMTGGSLTTVSVTDPKDTSAAPATDYVKPLSIEQRMTKDDPSACSTLSSTDFSAYTLPDLSLWADPVVANGTEPVVTAAPAVIGGVLQQ